MPTGLSLPTFLGSSLFLLLALSYKTYALCQSGMEYFSSKTESCNPCTRCAPLFTLRPCAAHADTVCGPLSALELDLSFLSRTTSRVLWRFPEVGGEEEQGSFDHRTPLPDDRIPWDWQTGALILAVCACILFFLAAGCSALLYARQWRRIKRNFEPAGLEEISARLNLMVKAELAELVGGAPMNPGDPETRCLYLEKLLDRKRETPVTIGWPEVRGNLYIEERENPKAKKLQIAKIHRNIETILNQKRNSG